MTDLSAPALQSYIIKKKNGINKFIEDENQFTEMSHQTEKNYFVEAEENNESTCI